LASTARDPGRARLLGRQDRRIAQSQGGRVSIKYVVKGPRRAGHHRPGPIA
jgi:hypothetical protein